MLSEIKYHTTMEMHRRGIIVLFNIYSVLFINMVPTLELLILHTSKALGVANKEIETLRLQIFMRYSNRLIVYVVMKS